jgi:hypothetical protein
MRTVYNVYIDGNKIGKSTSRTEAIEYLQENYEHILPHLSWEPLSGGGIDCWGNGISEIMVEKNYPEGVDILFLIKDHEKKTVEYEDEKEEPEDEIDHEERKRMPFTPRRTTLKMKQKKRVSVAKVGEIKEGEDGKKYISKEMANGKIRWTKYVEKTYKGPPVKSTRKCPSKPAKNFPFGTVKKGLDGKKWIVTTMTNGNIKWSRKVKM